MTNTSQLLSYVQMLDSAFPIGSFSHSFGMETFVQHGKIVNMDQLEQYMQAQLRAAVIPMDVVCIQGMYRALENKDEVQLMRLDAICHTQRSARESREGLHKMGKRLMRLGKHLYPQAGWSELERLLQQHNGYGTYVTVFVWIAWHLKLEQELVISGYLYTTVQMMVSSALRLMSLGQTDGQLLVSRTVAYALQQWNDVQLLYHDKEPYSFSLVQDIMAMKHEILYSRLFMS